jgi:DNA-binding NarL/FixJ family response regulator
LISGIKISNRTQFMSKTALIAESNKMFLEALAGTLSFLGFSVVGRTTKMDEAIDLARETKPDLLIFDLHLSKDGLAGCSDLKLLKEQRPEMKILALGCHEAVDKILAESLKAGFDGFWSKYDNQLGLINTINILLP